MSNKPETEHPPLPEGQILAVIAEGLYMANLLMLPGIAFIAILLLYYRNKESASQLALCHLRQTIAATLWVIALIVLLNLVIIYSGGYGSANMWLIILAFEFIHIPLILIGVIGAVKALRGKMYQYPLIGVKCD